MQIIIRRNGSIYYAEIAGDLDHHSAKLVAAELDKIIQNEKLDILILDMKKLSFMDSSGLGVILGRYKQLKEKNATLQFMNVPKSCDKLLSMSGVYSIAQKIN